MKRKTPRYKHIHRQLSLPFSASVKSMSYWTGTIGELFEEASATLSGGRRLIADSDSQYSPDVEVRKDEQYVECKACGRSGRVILYSRRAEREETWATQNSFGHFYHIWRHKFVTKEYTNEEELLINAPTRVVELCILPASVLFGIARQNPIRTVNRWNPLGYTDGWLVSYTSLRAVCEFHYLRSSLHVASTLPVRFSQLNIYSHSPLDLPTHAIRKLKLITGDKTNLRPEQGGPF